MGANCRARPWGGHCDASLIHPFKVRRESGAASRRQGVAGYMRHLRRQPPGYEATSDDTTETSIRLHVSCRLPLNFAGVRKKMIQERFWQDLSLKIDFVDRGTGSTEDGGILASEFFRKHFLVANFSLLL